MEGLSIQGLLIQILWIHNMIGARGFPLRLILSLGAMGWGSGQIQKLFVRRRRRRPILTKSHQGFWILEMLLLDQSPMWNW